MFVIQTFFVFVFFTIFEWKLGIDKNRTQSAELESKSLKSKGYAALLMSEFLLSQSRCFQSGSVLSDGKDKSRLPFH